MLPQRVGEELPTLFKSVQTKAVQDKLHEKFPLILTSGRLVEYEGGGEETRSNPWLAELQQEAYVEINPKAAQARGIRNGERVWLSSPTGARLNVQAIVHALGVDAVSLFRSLARRRHVGALPQGRGPRGARRGGQHGHHLWL